jgi:hypothetical protein
MEKVAVRKLGERLIRRVTRASEAIYTAWEPSIEDGTHDTTDDVDGVRFGRVDSRRFAGRLVGDITADVQSRTSWTIAQQAQAYEIIRRAFPESAHGMRVLGTIRLLGDPEIVAARPDPKKSKR